MILAEIINLKNYTVAEHVFFALGCLLWVFTYVIVIKNIRKIQFVEIPLMAVLANYSWEFLWSWVFKTDMGELYVWGYRIWFFLDCFILYGLFKYGIKQVAEDLLKKTYYFNLIFGLASWMFILYFYIKLYDLPYSHMGAFSGYILNVMMSALYITFFLRMKQPSYFSYLSSWFKGVGTLLITVFCFLHFSDWFLLSMCIVTSLLDLFYIFIFSTKRTNP